MDDKKGEIYCKSRNGVLACFRHVLETEIMLGYRNSEGKFLSDRTKQSFYHEQIVSFVTVEEMHPFLFIHYYCEEMIATALSLPRITGLIFDIVFFMSRRKYNFSEIALQSRSSFPAIQSSIMTDTNGHASITITDYKKIELFTF